MVPATALVLRALGLGDLLTAVPALRGLRAALPGHHIRLAAPARFEPLLRLSDTIDSVADTHEPDVLRPPPPDHPDIAVNLHGCGPGSHRYLLARGPRRLVAFAHAGLDVAGPEFTPDEHEVHRWCRLIEESFGVACDPDLLDLRIPEVPPPIAGAAIVHPGAAHRSRQWPPERFGVVARDLRQRGLQVVVTGDARDQDAARIIAESAGIPGHHVLAGTTDLLQLAAQVGTAPVVISGDTGVAHLASAYRRPSVTLCGPISPALWGPPPRPQHIALWHGDGKGNPWGEQADPALLRIEVIEVLAAVEAVLAVKPAEPAPGMRAVKPAEPAPGMRAVKPAERVVGGGQQ